MVVMAAASSSGGGILPTERAVELVRVLSEEHRPLAAAAAAFAHTFGKHEQFRALAAIALLLRVRTRCCVLLRATASVPKP